MSEIEVEVGMPVYHARDTLPAALDSLICQTMKEFKVCISIDGDEDKYEDIINTYEERGLNIRTIYSEVNEGPGMARQKILDSTDCKYITFLDADDMFMPRAVQVMYNEIESHKYNLVRGSFIQERGDKEDRVMKASDNVVTWFHSKMYLVGYLRLKNIRFLPEIRADEDAYFNSIAWNSTPNKGLIEEVLYLWRNNENSITRSRSTKEYFLETSYYYVHGQIEALKKIYQITNVIIDPLINQTLINIYYYCMKARFYKADQEKLEECVVTLKDEEWMKKWLNNGANWLEILNSAKTGAVYDNEYAVFFEEPFNKWIHRLLIKGNEQNKEEENKEGEEK